MLRRITAEGREGREVWEKGGMREGRGRCPERGGGEGGNVSPSVTRHKG